MKILFTLLICILLHLQTRATNYYLSALGSDTNSGKSSASPWKTLIKLNSVTFAPKDTVFLRCGDTFRGSILLKQSGTSAGRIVFTSYGVGNKPIISGAEPVTNWTLSAGVYQASFNSTTVTNFFVDNKEQILARYPNDHQYLTLDSAGVRYLKDASLASLSPSLINGSKLCVHTAQWSWEKTSVMSYSGDKIIYGSTLDINAIANYGYFLYDNLAHLDVSLEWKYDATTKKLNYIPAAGQNPNMLNCEVSVYANGIELADKVSYIKIYGLAFEKQANAGVSITDSLNQNNIVDNCYFGRQYNHGVHDKGRYNEISNSYFREVDGIAVFANENGGYSTIHHNTFRNIGQFRNSGLGTQFSLSAIKTGSVNDCHIHHNNIDSVGYSGISADGKNHMVERNIVKNAMLINNDGAALKSYGDQSQNVTFRNNFVSTSDGNTEGTHEGNFSTPAIYFDFKVNNSKIQDNTIFDHAQKGIFINSGCRNNTITGNVVYGGNYCLDLNGDSQNLTPMVGMVVKHNSFFALPTTQFLVRQVDYTNAFAHGTLDSNYYFNPYKSNQYALRIVGTLPNTTSVLYSFAKWQLTGNDPNTKSSFVNWASTVNDSKLFMNPSDDVLEVDLKSILYKDLNNNSVCGTLVLQPYTSKILIATSGFCSPSITSFSPGTAGVGAIITITGNNFSGATAVSFGGTAASSFTVVSSTSITATLASGATGSVSVTTAGGTATKLGFTYSILPVITSFTPTSASSGAAVTITGTNFTGATSVKFGATPAASFTVISPSTITATLGAGASGSVSVTTPAGTATLAGFTYTMAPNITGFSPASAGAGATVTITGTNFTGATSVKFGSAAATSFTVVSPTSITAVVGEGSTEVVSVTTANGTGSKSGFTFIPIVTIAATGPTTFGTGGSVNLLASIATDYTYRWYKNGTEISGATSVNYTASASGSYMVSILKGSTVISTSAAMPVELIFTLPAGNFALSSSGELCRSSNNGKINIVAVQTLSYTATLTGTGVNTTHPFTNALELTNISAGNYTVCITVAGQAGYKQCYDVIITEPQDLAVLSSINATDNSVLLNMSGSNAYTVELNGVVHKTEENTLILSLKNGDNNLKVSADTECMGVIEKVITIPNQTIIYPNPFTNLINISSGTSGKREIKIYNSSGGLVYAGSSNENSFDLPGLNAGVYVLKLLINNTESFYKILKN